MIIHYLYRHVRPDLNVPFYIGIGHNKDGNRIEYDRAYDKFGRSRAWEDVFIECNRCIDVEIMYESSSRDEINRKEREFIALYGKAINGGLLCNLTDGGDGVVGHKVSEKTKQALRVANLGKTLSDEHKEKIRLSNLGKKRTEATKMKIRVSKTGKKLSEEVRLRLKGKGAGRKLSDEQKRKIALSHLGIRPSVESRIKMSASHKGLKNNKKNA